jgi:cytochrome c oxidase subunit 2
MEIHRYEKLWFGVALLLILGFIGTITYGAVGAGIDMVDDEGGTVDPDNIGSYEIRDGVEFQDIQQANASHVEGNEYEIAVTARRFIFNPGSIEPIEVPEDSRVTFYITSPDVIHGFNIVGTNVNTMVIPGEMATITVEFEEPAEYGIVCNEFCGSGHETMAGNIHVVPEEEWGGDA